MPDSNVKSGKASVTVEQQAAQPTSDGAPAPGETVGEIGEESEVNEQPTFVLPEQPTIVLQSPTLSRKALRAAKAAATSGEPQRATDAPNAANAPSLEYAMRASRDAARFLAARPWMIVLALLICVFILALVSRQIGG